MHTFDRQLIKRIYTAQKKSSFSLRIFSANMTKSAGNCKFGNFTEELVNGKLYFLCSVRSWYFNTKRNNM